MQKTGIKTIILLHLLMTVYSANGIVSKMAAANEVLSFKWCLFYGIELVILAIYALGWQQIIKRMDLTTAYANKAVTVIWGLVWGLIFFGEKVTAGKLIGAALVVAGVVLFSISDDGEAKS